MRAYRWMVLGALGLAAVIACGAKSKNSLGPDGDDAGPRGSDDDSGTGSTSSGGGSSSGTGPGTFHNDSDGALMTAPSDCKAGNYQGSFTGSYSSGLIAGIPLSVSGDVNLTLRQAGGAQMMCMIQGEGFETCSNVFTLSGGTITGVANKAGMIGDATIGGFPYFCTMTGTLDCAKKVLLNGWIQCTYCVGPLADGGGSCTIDIGGHFAGPLTSDYFYSTDGGGPPAFGTPLLGSDPGQWNGAESLAGNDGTMPGPEGGPISDYLALDGGYGFLGKYGGSGTWNATLQK
jgi:hypothetical protein